MNERLNGQLVDKLIYLERERDKIGLVLGKQYWHYDTMLKYAIRDIEKKLEEEDEKAA